MSESRTRKQSTREIDGAHTPKVETPEAPAPKATPTPDPCRCGCGEATRRPEARYVSGHDARHAGEVGRSDATEAQVREIFKDAPKLVAKALGVRETAARKAQAKVEAAALREELAAKLAEVKAAHAAK